MTGPKGVQPNIARAAQNYFHNISAQGAAKKNEVTTVDVKAKPVTESAQTVGRQELDNLSPYSGLVQLSSVQNVDAAAINKILQQYNCPKVAPAQIASIANGVNKQILPGLNTASENADVARTNPDDKSLKIRMGYIMENFESLVS